MAEMTAQPKNLLEYHLNEASARRTAEKIAAAQQARAVAEQPPQLKEVRVKDQAGRVITSFEGEHPSAWMRQFESPPKRLVAINTK
jgi:hypothetical protein